MENKDLYKLELTIFTIMCMVVIGFLYIINVDAIVKGYSLTPWLFYVVLIDLYYITCISSMTLYIFHEWFKQEKQYVSDLPFLFGLTFLILCFGKCIDLLFFLTFFTLGDLMTLILMKARWVVVLLTVLPMVYLSIGMFLYYFSLKDNFEKLKKEENRNKIRIRFLAIITFIEIMVIIIVPDVETILLILPLFVIPSLIMIVWLFYFSWKNKALNRVNSKILTLGFLLILVAQFIRPMIYLSLGNEYLYVIITEIFSIFVFTLVFIGFYKKPNYV